MSIRVRPLRASRRLLRSVAPAALVIALSLGLAACGGSGASSATKKDQKLPALPAGSNSSPSVAVESYLSALARHDDSVAKKLIYPKVRKGIVSATGSGFTDLTSITDVKVISTATGAQYTPTVSGVSFTKFKEFAQVTTTYKATFSVSTLAGGTQTKLITLGEASPSKWLILAVEAS